MSWPGHKQCHRCLEKNHPAVVKCAKCGFEFETMLTADRALQLLSTNNEAYVVLTFTRKQSRTEIASYGIDSDHYARFCHGKAKYEDIRVVTFRAMLRKGWIEKTKENVNEPLRGYGDTTVSEIYTITGKGQKAAVRKADRLLRQQQPPDGDQQ